MGASGSSAFSPPRVLRVVMIGTRDARRLVRDWETMQTWYLAVREARFERMLDLLGSRLPPDFRALDLGSGPGSLSARILARFPRSRCVALDYDPVLMTIGRAWSPPGSDRLTWVEADLRTKDWPAKLGRERFDAIVSTTALHWLSASELRATYREAWKLLRKGGIFLNGDRATVGPRERTLKRMGTAIHQDAMRARGGKDLGHPWTAWWKEARRYPSLRPLFEERERRFPKLDHQDPDLPASVHLQYLRAAGFSEAEVLWRDLSNAITVGIK